MTEVTVDKGGLEKAMKILKRKLIRDGFFKELKQRRYYLKPSEKKKRKLKEAQKRRRKENSKRNSRRRPNYNRPRTSSTNK